MISSDQECPACGSCDVVHVVYGYPAPDEQRQAEVGQAILAGPQPYDGMPTLRCGHCHHWWRHDGLTVKDFAEQAPNLHYALGHYTYVTPEGVKIVFHAGGNPGLRALLVIAPDRNGGFFAVANNDRGSDVLAAMLAAWGQYYGLTVHAHF